MKPYPFTLNHVKIMCKNSKSVFDVGKRKHAALTLKEPKAKRVRRLEPVLPEQESGERPKKRSVLTNWKPMQTESKPNKKQRRKKSTLANWRPVL